MSIALGSAPAGRQPATANLGLLHGGLGDPRKFTHKSLCSYLHGTCSLWAWALQARRVMVPLPVADPRFIDCSTVQAIAALQQNL